MSASESVRASLGAMDFVQLFLLFAALLAYVLTLGEGFPARVRGAAALVALIAAAGFSAMTPTWVAGVVVLALAISAVAAFAAAVWLFAALLRLDASREPRTVDGREKLAVPAAAERLPARSAAIRSS